MKAGAVSINSESLIALSTWCHRWGLPHQKAQHDVRYIRNQECCGF